MEKQKNLYYEKVKKYYYNVYDVNNYGLNIAEFESLEELTQFINRYTNKQYSKNSVRVMIANNQIIADCLEVVKDSVEYIENINTMEW